MSDVVVISAILDSVRRARRAIASPFPVTDCYLGNKEYNAVKRYAYRYYGLSPNLAGWPVIIGGARIRHLRELKAANQTARSVPSQHGEDQHD
jgi:hypothetical protein